MKPGKLEGRREKKKRKEEGARGETARERERRNLSKKRKG